MTKLSETKHGDRFTVEMTRVDTTGSGNWANVRFNDGPLIFVHMSEANKIEVAKLSDPRVRLLLVNVSGLRSVLAGLVKS